MLIATLMYFFFSCCCAFLLENIVNYHEETFTTKERWILFFLSPLICLLVIYQIIQEYVQNA